MARDRQIIKLIREEYERLIYSTLLEMEVVGQGGKVMLDRGLAVKDEDNKIFTVQSVQQNGEDTIVNLIPAEGTLGPITSEEGETSVSPGQTPVSYSLKDFQNKFDL